MLFCKIAVAAICDGLGESPKAILSYPVFHFTYYDGPRLIVALCMVGSVSLRFDFRCRNPFRLFVKERFLFDWERKYSGGF